MGWTQRRRRTLRLRCTASSRTTAHAQAGLGKITREDLLQWFAALGVTSEGQPPLDPITPHSLDTTSPSDIVTGDERWTRSQGAADAAHSDTESYCPMHPTVIRDNPKEKCPI